ncbi:transporter substrate-binding domain-containing protein [Bordetella hinzii]|uniref:transporter substrate-binding domain-containing protein n=1 Tax=Bordetella hinzii TaxID=103855 RepID=UPI001C0360B7|nr:transporter substrate-binding domain-containing protein [Bordetella hinzii]QWF38873.1 transporter substrate-binding domain-containing protein [Bordetella hinzii]
MPLPLAWRLLLASLAAILSFLGTAPAAWAAAAGRSLPAGSTAEVPKLSVDLNADDWQWLAQQRELRVGIFSPDYAPFQFTQSQRFQGLNADYLKIISHNLGLIPAVTIFPDRDSALRALSDGLVDVVDDVADGTLMGDRFSTTQPYISHPAVVVARREQGDLPPDLKTLRVAVNPRSQPAALHRGGPQIRWTSYADPLLGLSAVADGQADVYLGDPLAVAYYLTAGIFSDMQVQRRDDLGMRANVYTLLRSNNRLRHILDQTIASIPDTWRQNAVYRWGLPSGAFIPPAPLALTEKERRWMERHPVVRVRALNLFPPFSMHSQDSTALSGLSIDMLQRIGRLTGLRFSIKGADSTAEMKAALQNHEADMSAGLFWSESREDALDFSTPYLSTAFVLVGKQDGPRQAAGAAGAAGADFAGARIASVPSSAASDVLRRYYPQARLVSATSPNDALLKVLDGKADFAVQTQIAANFYLRNYFRDELRIVTALDTVPARLAFAFPRDQDELQSIINKALAALPADEPIYLMNRWRAESPPTINTWYAYRQEIYLLIAAAAASAVIFLAWILYLRRQIRKRRKAERALSDQLAFMRVLLDGIPNPVFVRDRQGRMVTCNRSYLDTFGMSADDVVGRTLLESPMSAENPQEAARVHQQYLLAMEESSTPVFQDIEVKLRGKTHYIYHWLMPYSDSLGQVSGLIGGWTDLTERMQLLRDLHEAKEEADAANRAKTTFLATMSHEIRTPMNAIIGMLELVLRRPPGQQADREALQVAYDSARSLLDLIGDILDISKIEADKLELTPIPTDLRHLLEGVVNVFQGMARQNGLSLKLSLAPSSPPAVSLDAVRLKQVVSNLVSNALKFTEVGGVTVSLNVAVDDDGQASIEIAVDDSGPGISAADRRKLFEPFTQVHDEARANKDRVAGTGLGLAISRRIIEAMGGSFELSSIPGKGTRIDLHLRAPLISADTPPPSSMQAVEQQDLRTARLKVLVIDDHAPNRMLLGQQLAYIGHDVLEAADGAQGVALWRQHALDAVLTDCNMPGMSGYDVAREIRRIEAEEHRPRTVIYAITASAQAEEFARCEAAGMDGCLFKPLDIDTLKQRLLPLAVRKAEDTPMPFSPATFRPQGLLDLTQDDAVMTRRIAEELIKANRQDIADLMQASSSQDPAAVADLAHRIAGGARVVAADQAVAQAQALEAAARGGQADTAPAVEALVQALQALEADLQAWLASRE